MHVVVATAMLCAIPLSSAHAIVLVDEDFDGYSNTAQLSAVWVPIGTSGGPNAGVLLSSAQSGSSPNSAFVPGISIDGLFRSRHSFTETSTYSTSTNGNLGIGDTITWSFDFYDIQGNSAPQRNYANLQDSLFPGGANQLVAMGLNNNLGAAAQGGNYYMARILGHTPEGQASGDFFKLNDVGAPLRSTGWNNLKVEVSTANGTSTDYKFYVNDTLAKTVSGVGNALQIPSFDNIVIGSGLGNNNMPAYFDNVRLEYAPWDYSVSINGTPIDLGSTLDFGPYLLGEENPYVVLDIQNKGNAAIDLSNILAGSPFAILNAPSTIAAKGTGSITLDMSTLSLGSFNNTFSFDTNLPTGHAHKSFSLNLSGEVVTGGIFAWEYINPGNPSQGKQQSTQLVPDGAGVIARPGADLAGRDLTMAYLIGKNLTNANLSNTTLVSADFTDAMIQGTDFSTTTVGGFSSAQLYSTASYQNHDLIGVKLNNNNLAGWNFANQNLRKAGFASSTLTGTNFTGADVREADFSHTTDKGFTAGQLYSTSSYQSNDVSGIKLAGNNVAGWNFAGKNLTNSSFDSAQVSGTNFTNAHIQGANFQATSLSSAQLYSTASYQSNDLTGVNLGSNDLSNWNLGNKNLTNASFSSSNLNGTNFTGANIQGADLSSATQNGFTRSQFYSTSSYQSGNLAEIDMSNNDMGGVSSNNRWSFIGRNLTSARFRDANLNNATFVNANLTNADFSGSNLAGAEFNNATLTQTNLASTNLTAARFIGTKFNFANVHSSNIQHANFVNSVITNTDFSGSNLANSRFDQATLKDCNFSDSNLNNVYFYQANLTNTDFSNSNLTGASFGGATLTGANFSNAEIRGAFFGFNPGFTSAQLYSTASYQAGDLSGIGLLGHDMSGWDFAGKNLTGAGFGGATLTNADFSGSNLTGTSFVGTTLTGANFTNAQIQSARFGYSTGFTSAQLYSTASYQDGDLSGIGLSSDMSDWDFAGKNLTGASFGGALTGANFTNAQIQSARFDSSTGFTSAQLYSTASYQAGDLSGIGLSSDMSGWSFAGKNLTGASLSYATLTNADFSGATLTWVDFSSADLTHADFRSSNLTSATFYGSALSHADFRGAILTNSIFQNADLSHANMSVGNLSGSDLSGGTLSNANLSDSDIIGAELRNANLTNANLSGSDLTNAVFSSATVSGANFSNAQIRGANFRFATGFTSAQLYSTASYQAGNLSGIELGYLNMSGWSFAGKNLTEAGFWNATLNNADFNGSNLANSYFVFASLTNADFSGANLTYASFFQATLNNADFSGANLTGASLDSSIVSGANFTNAQIQSARFDSSTGFTSAQLYSTASYQDGDLSGIGLYSLNMSGWSFAGKNLTGASLVDATLNNADFSGANLTGAYLNSSIVSGANFTNAQIQSARFDYSTGFTSAQLYSTASYQDGDLSGIGLYSLNMSGWSFAGKNLTGASLSYATLTNADFSGSNLTNASFIGTSLTGANFAGAQVSGAYFSYTPGFTSAQLYSTASYQAGDLSGIGLPGKEMSGWSFAGKNLTGANFQGSTLNNADLRNSNLTGAIMVGALSNDTDFSGSDLTHANLWAATLIGANFTNTQIQSVYLGYTTGFTSAQLYSTASYQAGDLRGIGLSGNDMSGWSFAGKNLTGASLSYATLTNADFSGSNLTNASFIGTSLTGANFAGAQVSGAYFGGNIGFTSAQLYSTASYQAGELGGIILSGINLSGWSFVGQNLAGLVTDGRTANFQRADLSNADFSQARLDGADMRGAINADFSGALSTVGMIHPDGHVDSITASAVVRNYTGEEPIGIRVTQEMSLNSASRVQIYFDDVANTYGTPLAWNSTISFASAVPVALNGTLDLKLEIPSNSQPGVDAADQLNRAFRVFDWTGVTPNGTFATITGVHGWDASNLYTTGEVKLTAALTGTKFETHEGTVSNVLAGEGIGLVKSTAGTTILAANNTYTGTTLVSEGTLQIGDGGTSGSLAPNSSITNNGQVIFNRSDANTYSGAISGLGKVEKLGAGVLTLTGDHTYSGGTTISEGTLQIGDGGTTGSLAGSGGITNNAALVFNRSNDLSYSGSIRGTGSVTKAGTGTLTITGEHTYLGGTTVANGRLAVNGSITGSTVVNFAGTLAGNGTIRGNVASGGRVAPGNSPGILVIEGDYTQSATSVLEIEIGGLTPGTQHDQVQVGGHASLNGTFEFPIIDGFQPQLNDEVTFLVADSISNAPKGVFAPNLREVDPDLGFVVIKNAEDLRLRFVAPTNIQFVDNTSQPGIDREDWNEDANWTVGTTQRVPSTADVVELSRSQTGSVARVDVKSSDATTHELIIHDPTSPITVGVKNGYTLSAATGDVLVGENATLELGTPAGTSLGTVATSNTKSVSIHDGGMLSGNGTVKASELVVDGGIFRPGFSVGHVTVEGDYRQTANGVLAMDIEGVAQHDTVSVSGDMSLSGKLQLDISNYSPTPGTTFQLMSANSVAGKFESVEWIGNNDIYFVISYISSGSGSEDSDLGGSGGSVPGGVYGTSMHRGDMDGNLIIDNRDYDLFVFGLMNNSSSKFFNKCNCNITPQQGGDFNGNGRLDFDDIPLFQQSLAGMGMSDFGLQMAFERYYSNVPEPSTAMLVLLGQFLWGVATPRRPKRGESAERLF